MTGVLVHTRRFCCLDRIGHVRVAVGNESMLSKNPVNQSTNVVFTGNTECLYLEANGIEQLESFFAGCEPFVEGHFVVLQQVLFDYSFEFQEIDLVVIRNLATSSNINVV